VIVGTRAPDVLTGTDCNDQIFGRAGGDVIRGKLGYDVLRGGRGPDRIADTSFLFGGQVYQPLSNGTFSLRASDGTLLLTANATDADVGQTLTYSIVGGADKGGFSIHPTSGVLAFAAVPNYESPTDSDRNNVYEVVVRVSDGFITDSQTLSVTVTNNNESPIAVDDTANVDEDNSLSVIPPGLLANDTDVDFGDTKTVIAVNGQPDSVGKTISLASGALLFVQSNGSYQYSTNGKFNSLAAAHANAGDFDQAKSIANKAVNATPQKEMANVRQRLELYQSGRAYREGAPAEPIRSASAVNRTP
jgi:hypothetical protein